ncbi:MAG: hypothetical protein HYW64_01620, partial [Candidatus Levybacteria bacterium]|nr:hypothetical protein [Candidatus Levybacteria bacterium]
MTATGHAVIGTVIAAKVGNPALAIPLALASHIAADFIPHWDTGTNREKKGLQRVLFETIFDVLLSFALSYGLLVFLFPKTEPLYAFLIILASQSFDWLMAPYYFFGIKAFKWAYDLQKLFDNKLDKPWG